jgi:hypothetical protein
VSRHRKSGKRAAKPAATPPREHKLPARVEGAPPEPKAGPDRPDRGFIAICGLLACIAIWVLLMPWVPSISLASMQRFHLGSSSFLAWAAQFPIPAMYNFANRAEIHRYPPGLVDPLFEESETRHLNHFPIRCLTFADGRYRELHHHQDRWITVDTTYRGRTIETNFHVKANPNGRFDLIRLPDTEVKSR